MVKRLTTYMFTRYYHSDKTGEDELGETYSTCGKRSTQNSDCRIFGETPYYDFILLISNLANNKWGGGQNRRRPLGTLFYKRIKLETGTFSFNQTLAL